MVFSNIDCASPKTLFSGLLLMMPAIKCYSLGTLRNGVIKYGIQPSSSNEVAWNVTARFSCNPGFTLRGNSSTRCGNPGYPNGVVGQWSVRGSTCIGE